MKKWFMECGILVFLVWVFLWDTGGHPLFSCGTPITRGRFCSRIEGASHVTAGPLGGVPKQPQGDQKGLGGSPR